MVVNGGGYGLLTLLLLFGVIWCLCNSHKVPQWSYRCLANPVHTFSSEEPCGDRCPFCGGLLEGGPVNKAAEEWEAAHWPLRSGKRIP